MLLLHVVVVSVAPQRMCETQHLILVMSMCLVRPGAQFRKIRTTPWCVCITKKRRITK